MKKILLTGATGYMGSHFLFEYLIDNPDIHIICIVRKIKNIDTKIRLENAMLEAANNSKYTNIDYLKKLFYANVEIIEGLFYQDNLNLSSKEYNNLNIDEIWHFAAHLSLISNVQIAHTIKKINYLGTEKLLKLAIKCSAIFNYISTSYVAGEKTSMSYEALIDSQNNTNNPYEYFKRKIEFLIITYHKKENLSYRIFRPSIIICHSKTGLGNTNAGFYGMITMMNRLQYEVSKRMPEYFNLNPIKLVVNSLDAGLNFMHIDIATKMILHISKNSSSLHHIFHITNNELVSLQTCANILYRISKINVLLVSETEKLNFIDILINKELKEFASYLFNNHLFDNSKALQYSNYTKEDLKINLEQFEYSTKDFLNKIQKREEILKKRSGSYIQTKMLKKTVPINNNLIYYIGGNGKKNLLIINAYGQSLHVWSKLFPLLHNEYKIIVWEIQEIFKNNSSTQIPSIHRYIEDIQSIINNENILNYHVLAWCTGPKLAIELTKVDTKVQSLMFLNPSFQSEEESTPYEKNIMPLCHAIDKNNSMATNIKEACVNAVDNKANPMESLQNTYVKNLISLVDTQMQDIIITPYIDENSIINYAKQLLEYWNYDVTDTLRNITIPILFLTGENDNIASSSLALKYATECNNYSYFELQDGCHYIHYKKPHEVVKLMKLLHDNKDVLDLKLYSKYIQNLK